MTLPVRREIPEGLNHKTGLKKLGLAPTGDPVAQYEYRTRKGYERCNLYPVAAATPIDRKAEYQSRKACEIAREQRRQNLETMFAEEVASLEADALAEAQEDWRKALRRFERWAADPNMLIVDTETTGLTGEVIEIAVVTLDGTPLLDTLVRATVPIEPGAHQIHGLTDMDLKDAPTWPEVVERLKAVTRGHWLLAFSADFDRQACAASNAAHGLDNPLSDPQYWACAMTAYAPLGWTWSERRQEWRWISLRDACLQRGVAPEADTHRALGGAQALARLVLRLAQEPPEPPEPPATLPEGMSVTAEDVGWRPEGHPHW